MAHTMGVKRGCGVRAAGGIYLETGMSDHGRPVEDFLICPPIPVDLDALGITEVGVHLVEYKGQKVIMDVVGRQHYPNVADFVEEVRRFGVSRRAPITLPWDELDARVLMVFIHRNAVIKNTWEYSDYPGATWTCPKGIPRHHPDHDEHLSDTCGGLWWRDLPPMDPSDQGWVDAIVEMPSFTYRAARRPATIVPEYQYGIFGVFPVTNVSVIHTQDEGRLRKAVTEVAKSPLSYSIDLE